MNAYDCINCEYNDGDGRCTWWECTIDAVDECEEMELTFNE